MIARSTISFADMRKLLLDLGYAPSRQGQFWFFEHAQSGTVFAFRPYRAREKVTLVDLEMTRKHLDWRGVLAPEVFDNLLNKATA